MRKVYGWHELITYQSLPILYYVAKKMLQAKWLRSKALVIGWFLVMNILFFIPGSDLPKTHWLAKIHVDKWVHVGLFGVLIFLFCSAFNFSFLKKIWTVLIVAIMYGFLVEIVQKFWVPNRSFDLYDVLADTAGSILGLLVWLRVYKNKPL